MKHVLLIASCMFTFLTSCKKDNTPSTNTVVPKIKRLMFIQGNINNIDFYYDNAGRVTLMNAYFGNSPINVPPSDSIFNFHFEYTGNNSLPSKFTYVNNILFPYYEKFVHFIQYNNNNQPVKDSVTISNNPNSSGFYKVTNFEYQQDLIICHERNWNNQTSSTSLSFLNGNFISANSYPIPNPNLQFWFYDYDNGINPLNSLNISPIFYLINDRYQVHFSYWSVWSLYNKNNFIRIKFGFNSISGTYSDTTSLSYSYNTDGLLQKRYWYKVFPSYIDTTDVIRYIYQ